MFATPAMAQTAGAAAASGGGFADAMPQILLFGGMLLAMYFLLLRPQSQRAKQQRAMLDAIKRGDTVVLSSGIVGKVVRVEDKEVQVEIAPTVTVKVVKAMISDVRAKGEPAPANDAPKAKA